MELQDAIHRRRAVRSYFSDSPSHHLLGGLIEAASWAPSAMNDQDWRFIVITDRILLDEISREVKAWTLSTGEQNVHLRKILSDPQSHLLHHAPALIVIAAPMNHRWATENCALAAENLMLAAAGKGLGSCWIGLVQDWLNSEEGRKLLHLAADERAMAPIVVGYPQAEAAPVARRKPAITWIGDHDQLVEDGSGSQPIDVPGLYGALIHP